MQRIYQRLLKQVNGYHKYISCTDLIYNNFEVLCSTIALYMVDLAFPETFKSKPIGNDSGFITYSNTIYCAGIWLDKYGYLKTNRQTFMK